MKRNSSDLILRVIVIIIISFIVATAVMWVFFKSNARSIGNYLSGPRRSTALILIQEYLGDPPSKFKAYILYRLYGLSFEYYRGESLLWSVGNPAKIKNEYIERHRLMPGSHGMPSKPPVGRMKSIWAVNLTGDGKLLVYFPVYWQRKLLTLPAILPVVVVGAIAIVIILLIRKTLMPVHEIIKASRKVGEGDLSYRINYKGKGDFREVVEAFNTMAEKLERMLKSQRELLHMISHEIRTPLARISLALELDDINRIRNLVKKEVKQVDELIDGIIELSRFDNDTIGSEKVNLAKIVKEVVKKLKDIYKKDYAVEFNVEEAFVRGRGVLVEKVVSNVVENAFKYSDGKSPIFIALSRENGFYLLEVKNSGKGLKNEEVKKVFMPFFRGSNAVDTNTAGKGLGLVVASRILNSLGGSITCESSPMGPTIFRLKFPTFNKTSK